MKRRGYGSQQTDLSELWSQMKQQFIGLLPTHIDGNVRMAGKYKLESEPCKSKIGTVSVEFRTQKFLGTVPGTKSRFRDKKTPKVTSKYTKAFFQNYEIATRFHKKNGISKLATFS